MSLGQIVFYGMWCAAILIAVRVACINYDFLKTRNKLKVNTNLQLTASFFMALETKVNSNS